MKYIDKLDLQTEELEEIETLEKHTIINNEPFTVDEYIGHDRDFLAIEGDYNDGFTQLNKTVTFGINCNVSKEVINARLDVNGNAHTRLKDRIDTEVNKISSDINKIDSDINELSSDINRIDSDINELSKTRNISSVNLLNTIRDEDCILITTIDGITILIDCGEGTSQEGIIENIDSLGIKKLDYFIITHFHSDHAGNAETIISKYHPTNIYYKEVVWNNLPKKEVEWKTKECFDKFISACQRNNILPN